MINLVGNKIKKGTIINIFPKKLHRIKALSNLTLYEVSSPHFEDVVRVQDDSARISGYAKSEHLKN